MTIPKTKVRPSIENEASGNNEALAKSGVSTIHDMAPKARSRKRPAVSRARYSKAEVHEIFRRFAVQRPEP
jgi:endonuclease-3